ncbi:phosphoribosylanthranilate isomerase [Bacillus sp. FJAT-42376]|uniref:phosphoribosylanthranilate isomerase n=1 Tax=Bacillus sp. FJAT-42376 TaxID=2014076 RepID=UPI000F4FC701|nr:phosphoribosylanthranilate isomerase [Bacillus sp. FJAT-42376]AZB43330.1 phosphoribosylanthranilate isomerase [Bacillus sp. FJAT-42376]
MIRPLLKYCGNKSREDYELAIHSEADYLGLIFADSKRKTEPETAAEWVEEFGRNGKKLTGVFVHPSHEEIQRACDILSLDAVQFHGEETTDFLKEFRQKNGSAEIWKAIPHDEKAVEKMERYAPFTDVFLIDSKVPGSRGGTGIAFDWSAVRVYSEKAEKLGKACFIAGGVNPENIADLLQTDPHGIDLASGIERNGMKNAERIRNLEKRVFEYVSR